MVAVKLKLFISSDNPPPPPKPFMKEEKREQRLLSNRRQQTNIQNESRIIAGGKGFNDNSDYYRVINGLINVARPIACRCLHGNQG